MKHMHEKPNAETEDACHFDRGQSVDFLTELPNRYAFEQDMEAALQDAKAEQSGYAILIDIGEFRLINQGYGYETGDRLIVDLARFLRSKFHRNCKIYRITCDNFILLCSAPESMSCLNEDIELITERFQSSWDIAEKSIYCCVNGSAVCFPHDGKTTADIFRNLDTALYRAKESGKNRFVVYQEEFESISSIIFKHREIEKMLYHAIKEDFKGFEVQYQPIHNSTSNGMVASEALLRYTSGGRFNRTGSIYPDCGTLRLDRLHW